MTTETKPTEGWAYPSATATAPHFFGTDRRSLCGRWAFFGTLEADDGVERRYDCKACRKKLAKRAPQTDEGAAPCTCGAPKSGKWKHMPYCAIGRVGGGT